MRTHRPRSRADALLLTARGQLTITLDLDPTPTRPVRRDRESYWRRNQRPRCVTRAGDGTRCTTPAAWRGPTCRLHADAP